MGTIVVTGGGTGIGRSVATWFAQRGESVTIVGRRVDVLKHTAAEIGATPVVCDLSSPAAIEAVLPDLPAKVDVLVNNAGGLARAGQEGDEGDTPLARTAQAWVADFSANVLTAVLTTKALEERFADEARIVTIGSIAARTGASSYGAAKAALEAWNLSIATSLGRRGITANVIAPGLTVDTEFFGGKLSRERYERLVAATKTGRPGTPDDVAATVGFLASPDARHITAQVIHVNGGAYSGH